jgi:hypothetical protein
VIVGALGALALVAGVVLAPTLGNLMEPERLEPWSDPVRALLSPEPVELARFAIAAMTPLVAATVLVFSRERKGRLLQSRPARALPALGALAVLSVLVVGWLTRSEPLSFGLDPDYFGERDLVVAILVAAAILMLALGRSGGTRISQARTVLLRANGTSRATKASGFVGVAATVIFMLPAVYTEASLADAPDLMLLHLPRTFADFAAFGNGATPLADFASQYSNLLPWLSHPVLAASGYSAAAFTGLMALLSTVSLLSLWRALALTTRNEIVGILLYLPVLALSLRPTIVEGDERDSNASLLQILPERYLFPCLLAWLCARHLRGLTPRTPVTLFLIGGLALFNNPEFGGPCLLATFFALLLGTPGPASRRVLMPLVGRLAAGVGAAAAVVVTVTLVRSGSLPSPELFSYYSRLFGAQGFGLLPMPTLGFHLIVYITLASALLLGALRHRAGAQDHALSGLLAYAGCFGLLAGIYYAGRSVSVSMVALFPVWSFALALLTWAAFRALSATPGGPRVVLRPVGALSAAALIGFGLAATAIMDVPAPWTQATRIADDSARESAFDQLPAAERFVTAETQEGDRVLVLRENGHLLAREAEVKNVSFLGDPVHVVFPVQLDDMIEDLRDAGGNAVFVGDGPQIPIHPGLREGLRSRGFAPSSADESSGLVVWRPRK